MFDSLKRRSVLPHLSAPVIAAVFLFSPMAFSQSAVDIVQGSEAGQVKAKAKAVEPITVKLKALKVQRDKAGKESLTAVSAVKPGDTIEYQAVYSNISKHPVEGVQAVLPIPKGTQYLGDSEKPEKALARTAAQREFAPIPLKAQVTDPQGSSREVLVPYSNYRELSWDLGTLPAKTSKTVAVRVKVHNGAEKTETAAANP
ncbi:hypothetical protein NUH87_30805 [Pseudomonas batumici]|uniref:hypothetical protein n=1 Tax=Pseudomonas batumici TaxID=226910 RepID=UPI0030CF7AA0